jgi:hypothetical protein
MHNKHRSLLAGPGVLRAPERQGHLVRLHPGGHLLRGAHGHVLSPGRAAARQLRQDEHARRAGTASSYSLFIVPFCISCFYFLLFSLRSNLRSHCQLPFYVRRKGVLLLLPVSASVPASSRAGYAFPWERVRQRLSLSSLVSGRSRAVIAKRIPAGQYTSTGISSMISVPPAWHAFREPLVALLNLALCRAVQ